MHVLTENKPALKGNQLDRSPRISNVSLFPRASRNRAKLPLRRPSEPTSTTTVFVRSIFDRKYDSWRSDGQVWHGWLDVCVWGWWVVSHRCQYWPGSSKLTQWAQLLLRNWCIKRLLIYFFIFDISKVGTIAFLFIYRLQIKWADSVNL